MPRTTSQDFRKIVSRVGYGVQSSLKRSTNVENRNTGETNNLESVTGDELEGPEKLSLGVSGKVRVRVTFFRNRLADYSRAISEKAWVDCLVMGGLLSNDSSKEIIYEDGGQEKVGSKAEERIEIELFYPEVDYNNLWVPTKKKDTHEKGTKTKDEG